MKPLFIDIKPSDEVWREKYCDPTMMTVRIGEENEGRLHSSYVMVSLENARILLAAQVMYKALCAEYDMLTPSDEADALCRKALLIAEGEPRPEARKRDPYVMHTCQTCNSESGMECTRRNCHLNDRWEAGNG